MKLRYSPKLIEIYMKYIYILHRFYPVVRKTFGDNILETKSKSRSINPNINSFDNKPELKSQCSHSWSACKWSLMQFLQAVSTPESLFNFLWKYTLSCLTYQYWPEKCLMTGDYGELQRGSVGLGQSRMHLTGGDSGPRSPHQSIIPLLVFFFQ